MTGLGGFVDEFGSKLVVGFGFCMGCVRLWVVSLDLWRVGGVRG